MGLNPRVHALGPAHADGIISHLRALTPMDRQARFGYAVSDAGLVAYVAGMHAPNTFVLGLSADTGQVLAFAHFGRTPGGAELGVSVLKDHRRLGLATALLGEVATTARRAGIEKLLCMHAHPAILRAAGRWALPVTRRFCAPRALIHLDTNHAGHRHHFA